MPSNGKCITTAKQIYLNSVKSCRTIWLRAWREVILRVASRAVVAESAARPVTQEELLAFSTALASDIPKSAAQIIAAERAAGRPAEDIYVNFLAPAARQLGDMWESDHITFAQVTVGSGRIFAIMRSLRHMFETSARPD